MQKKAAARQTGRRSLRELNRLKSVSANPGRSASALLTALLTTLAGLLTALLLTALSALMLLAGLGLAALTGLAALSALLRIAVLRVVLLLLLALRVLLLVRHVDTLRFREPPPRTTITAYSFAGSWFGRGDFPQEFGKSHKNAKFPAEPT